jgi:hypothetical protein
LLNLRYSLELDAPNSEGWLLTIDLRQGEPRSRRRRRR